MALMTIVFMRFILDARGWERLVGDFVKGRCPCLCMLVLESGSVGDFVEGCGLCLCLSVVRW